ncbi:MAG: BamA/TamA family outer membrane protein [Bacteroidota bacterium]|nr:BamA/TamA family outer membrane protein [Bacteroidota bacterium]
MTNIRRQHIVQDNLPKAPLRLNILVLLFLLFFMVHGSYGAAFAAQKPSSESYEVGDISFHIDGDTHEDVFRSMMQTLESPARFWTYMYKHVYQKFGAKPEYFDPITFDSDVDRIKKYLSEHGYFHAVVDTALHFFTASHTMTIDISIKENRRSLVDTVKIAGLDSLPEDVFQKIYTGRLVKEKSPFVQNDVDNERARIYRILLNNGYTTATANPISISRYLSTDNLTVMFAFHPGRRYVFGQIEIHFDKGEVQRDIVLRQLDFQPGEIYNEEKKSESEQNLNALGIFESAKIESLTPIDTTNPPMIPMRLVLRTRELQEVSPELLVDNENEAFNTGIGVGYSNRNFYGDARNFSTRLQFRLQSIQDLNWSGAIHNGFNEPSLLARADVQMQMIQPYFFSNKLNASWTVSGDYEKQKYYLLNALRNRIGFTNRFATYTLGFLDWNLERVAVDIKDTTRVSPELFTGTRQKQFNSILTFTLQRDKTNDVFSPTGGFFHTGSIEEAGVIPSLLGSLGGGLPYAQYYKLSFLGRQYFSANEQHTFVWALKLRGGFAKLYNSHNQTPVPPTRKFYAGGSGSVRGWKSRGLSASGSPDEGGNAVIEGNIETRINLFPQGGSFLSINTANFWGVLFVDYGNVWSDVSLVRPRDIAIAAGVGLRYETFVGPLRFDVGLRVYDPNERAGQQWIFEKTLFTHSFSLINFGIGQAF